MTTAGGDDPVGGQVPARPRAVTGAAPPGAGVLVGHDTHTGQEVWLAPQLRSRGITVVGKTGTGKSTLLERLILADLRAGVPAVVVDPHGRLAARVVAQAGAAADRLILLEPWSDRPWRLNLLECADPSDGSWVDSTADHAVETVKKLFGRVEEYLPRLERDLDAAVRTVIPNGGTLYDALRLFSDPALRAAYRRAVPPDSLAHEYWDFFERLGRETEQARQVEATVNRLYRLLAPQLLRRIIDSRRTTVPFDQVLDGDRVLLVSLPTARLTPPRCDFLGAVFLGGLVERIFAREAAIADPPRLRLYIDEYGRFATPMTAEFFFQGRKFGVDLTVAHQARDQLREAENRSAELQAGTLVLFALSGELDTTPTRTKVTMRQRTVPQYQEWDEEVWDSAAAQQAHQELTGTLASTRATVGKTLAARKAGYVLMERAYAATSHLTLQALLDSASDDVFVHLPFNPRYFYEVVPEQVVGGLRRWGEPDFWEPELAVPSPLHLPDYLENLRSCPCEGYVLAQEGTYSGEYLSVQTKELVRYSASFKRLRSRMGDHLVGDQIKLWKDPDVAWTLGEYLSEGSMAKTYVTGLGLLSGDEVIAVAHDLEQQLGALEWQLYRDALFWFCPNWKNLYDLAAVTGARHFAEDAWYLASTRPAVGQRRGRRRPAPRSWSTPDQWPDLGRWQVTAFPQAVAWLKQWIRETLAEITSLQQEFDGTVGGFKRSVRQCEIVAGHPLERRMGWLGVDRFVWKSARRYRGEWRLVTPVGASHDDWAGTARW